MQTTPLKVMTVVGTRPEIIRLSETIKLFDQHTNHVLVHTGQNYDYELNEVFFEDLNLRKPDYFLEANTATLGTAMGTILIAIEEVLKSEKPDAFLVLGDTNSCISAVMAKRMRVPVFHMEAGNRCFDDRVPEETNRRLVDHVADYNLVYSEHARRNLIQEGLHPARIFHTGSPMREVLNANIDGISASNVLDRECLTKKQYLLVSVHREENVENESALLQLIEAFHALQEKHDAPVIISTHPRTRKRLETLPSKTLKGLRFQKPYGFHDYIQLQRNALCVLSDSGTIAEESSILGFPAVTLRANIERPEAQDRGLIVKTGMDPENILRAVDYTISTYSEKQTVGVPDYATASFSHTVLSLVQSGLIGGPRQ